MITVLVPTFNRAGPFLQECLDSVFAQDYDDYEVLLVDDGSKDYTPQMAEYYWYNHKERLRYVRMEQNGGPAAALNEGVSRAKGEWIKWVSDDDLITPKCLRILDANSKDADLVIADFALLWHGFRIPIRQKDSLQMFGTMFRKDAFEKVGPFRKVAYGVDFDWMKRASIYPGLKLVRVPAVVAYWRYSLKKLFEPDWTYAPKRLWSYVMG